MVSDYTQEAPEEVMKQHMCCLLSNFQTFGDFLDIFLLISKLTYCIVLLYSWEIFVWFESSKSIEMSIAQNMIIFINITYALEEGMYSVLLDGVLWLGFNSSYLCLISLTIFSLVVLLNSERDYNCGFSHFFFAVLANTASCILKLCYIIYINVCYG